MNNKKIRKLSKSIVKKVMKIFKDIDDVGDNRDRLFEYFMSNEFLETLSKNRKVKKSNFSFSDIILKNFIQYIIGIVIINWKDFKNNKGEI